MGWSLPYEIYWYWNIGITVSHQNCLKIWCGQDKIFNRTAESMLAKIVSEHQTDWDYHLLRVLFVYRTAIHNITGFTTFHISFGRSPVLSLEAMIGNPHNRSIRMFHHFRLRYIIHCTLLMLLWGCYILWGLTSLQLTNTTRNIMIRRDLITLFS